MGLGEGIGMVTGGRIGSTRGGTTTGGGPPIGTCGIDGTSNIHEFSAATTEVRVTRLALASGVSGEGLLAAVLNPGAVEAFEIAIRAASLSSPSIFALSASRCARVWRTRE